MFDDSFLCIVKFNNRGEYTKLYLQVYNVVRIRKFDAVYLEKVFFPNKSDIRGINSNGKTSLELEDVDIHSKMHRNQNQDRVSKNIKG